MTLVAFAEYFHPIAAVQIATLSLTNLDGEGIRIGFDVSRSTGSDPDSARISLYGLSEENRAAAQSIFDELGRLPVSVQAGYTGVLAPLFAGDIRSLRATHRAGADIMTLIEADDSGDALADVTVNFSTASVDANTLIEIALAAFLQLGGVEITRHASVGAALLTATPGASAATYAGVHVGKATDLLDEAARLLGVRWWVRDGQLYMAKRNVPTDGIAVVLTDNHLLGEPSADGSGLTRIESLFDPNIEPGRALQIRGQTYVVNACSHKGDTSSGPWRTRSVLRRASI